MLHFQSFKITAWVFLVTFLLFGQSAEAQRYQLQFQFGGNFSKATIQDNGQSLRETSTFYDTIGNAQFGLAFRARLQKNFYLRLDGNFRAYRTFFNTQDKSSVGDRYILGNLISEKFNVSLLPEYRFAVSTHPYVFAGPVLSFERKKNYSRSFLIENGSQTIVGEIKPDAQAGWSVGAGINPRLFRFLGLLVETRYTRFGYSNEDIPVGKIAYGHFTVMLGLSVGLGK